MAGDSGEMPTIPPGATPQLMLDVFNQVLEAPIQSRLIRRHVYVLRGLLRESNPELTTLPRAPARRLLERELSVERSSSESQSPSRELSRERNGSTTSDNRPHVDGGSNVEQTLDVEFENITGNRHDTEAEQSQSESDVPQPKRRPRPAPLHNNTSALVGGDVGLRAKAQAKSSAAVPRVASSRVNYSQASGSSSSMAFDTGRSRVDVRESSVDECEARPRKWKKLQRPM